MDLAIKTILKVNTFNIINEKNKTFSEFVGQFLTTHQGRVFVPFKHVPVCNQKSVTKNMFLVHHENALFTIRWNMAVFIAVFR